jgi:hypothetical protein
MMSSPPKTSNMPMLEPCKRVNLNTRSLYVSNSKRNLNGYRRNGQGVQGTRREVIRQLLLFVTEDLARGTGLLAVGNLQCTSCKLY